MCTVREVPMSSHFRLFGSLIFLAVLSGCQSPSRFPFSPLFVSPHSCSEYSFVLLNVLKPADTFFPATSVRAF